MKTVQMKVDIFYRKDESKNVSGSIKKIVKKGAIMAIWISRLFMKFLL